MVAGKTLGDEFCVFLRNIALDLSIGILPEERLAPQQVIITVEMFLQDPGNFSSDDIADYVSYADVFEDIKSIQTEGKHIELVENLAETVAYLALKHEQVRRVIVTIEKPQIIPEVQSVGVSIERRK